MKVSSLKSYKGSKGNKRKRIWTH